MSTEIQTFNQALEVVAAKAPYLILIDNEISGVEDGIISFDVRVHKSEVRDIVVKKVKRIQLSKNVLK